MKKKSFAILAITSVIAATAAYVAPAMADDLNNNENNEFMQPASDTDGSAQGTTPTQNQNSAQTPSSGTSQSNMNSSDSMSAGTDNSETQTGSSTSGTDEASPDTATGDDDY